jgi:hypothetical protein
MFLYTDQAVEFFCPLNGDEIVNATNHQKVAGKGAAQS